LNGEVVNAVSGEAETGEDYVVVARILRTRGLRGEVVAEILTDFPERFDDTRELTMLDAEGRARATLELEKHWFQKNRVIFKFKNLDSIEAVEHLIPADLAIPEAECVALEEDEFYEWQLVGCATETIDGQSIGQVAEVLHTGGVPVLVIYDEQKREHLVPLAREICVEVDVENKIIRVDPPDNLLEL